MRAQHQKVAEHMAIVPYLQQNWLALQLRAVQSPQRTPAGGQTGQTAVPTDLLSAEQQPTVPVTAQLDLLQQQAAQRTVELPQRLG